MNTDKKIVLENNDVFLNTKYVFSTEFEENNTERTITIEDYMEV